MSMKLTIGDGSTGVHWRQTDSEEFFLDLRNLPKIKPNWDGHTTVEKWTRIAKRFGIEVEQ